jgi:hypothetical protein
MPYKLRKAPKRDLYWVVTSETGKKHSKEPIALEKAKAQKRILERALVGGLSAAHFNLIGESISKDADLEDAKEIVETILELLTPKQRAILKKTIIKFNVLQIDVLRALEILETATPETQEEADLYMIDLENTVETMKNVLEFKLPDIGSKGASKPSKFAPTKRGAGRGIWSQLLRALQRYAGVEGQGVMDDVIRDEIDTLPAGDFEGKKKVVLRAIRRYFPPDELLADAVYWQVHLAKVKEDLNMALSILNNDIKYRNSRSNNGRMSSCSGVGCLGTTGIMSSFGMGKKRGGVGNPMYVPKRANRLYPTVEIDQGIQDIITLEDIEDDDFVAILNDNPNFVMLKTSYDKILQPLIDSVGQKQALLTLKNPFLQGEVINRMYFANAKIVKPKQPARRPSRVGFEPQPVRRAKGRRDAARECKKCGLVRMVK